MRIYVRCILCVFLLLAFVMSANAQEEYIGPKAGNFSLSPQVSFSVQMPKEGDNTNSLSLASGIGYYFSREFEVGGFIYVSANGKDLTDFMMLSFQPYLAYHFFFEQSQRWAPFIGGGGGFSYFALKDFDDDYAGVVGAFGGIDYFATPSTALRVQVRYDRSFGKEDYSESGMVQVLAGLNIVF